MRSVRWRAQCRMRVCKVKSKVRANSGPPFASARLERKAVKLSRKPSNDTAVDEARIKAEFIATAVARDRRGHESCCGPAGPLRLSLSHLQPGSLPLLAPRTPLRALRGLQDVAWRLGLSGGVRRAWPGCCRLAMGGWGRPRRRQETAGAARFDGRQHGAFSCRASLLRQT